MRLSYEEQQLYFQRMVESLDSDVEDPEGDVEKYSDDDEDMIPTVVNETNDTIELQSQNEVELNDYTDSENEVENIDSDDDYEITESENTEQYTSKDGTKWYKNPPPLHRQGEHNIFCDKLFVGPNPATRNLSEVDTFACIMSASILDIICRHTNKKAVSAYDKWNSEHPDNKPLKLKPTNEEELSAYLGILLTMSCQRSNYVNVSELWKMNAFPLYRATMLVRRFKSFSRFIRFDLKSTRLSREATDKAAAISGTFEMINANLKHNYRPSGSITVDEQLYRFRGRTKFTQYTHRKK